MPDPGCRYAIVLVAAPSDRRVMLCATDDADAATTAYHTQLANLRDAKTTGELVLLKGENAGRPILRQPLDGDSLDGEPLTASSANYVG